jgi:hypothetical protein
MGRLDMIGIPRTPAAATCDIDSLRRDLRTAKAETEVARAAVPDVSPGWMVGGAATGVGLLGGAFLGITRGGPTEARIFGIGAAAVIGGLFGGLIGGALGQDFTSGRPAALDGYYEALEREGTLEEQLTDCAING